MNVIHSFCSWKRKISPDFFPLLTDTPSEDRNTTLSNNEERLNLSNSTFIASNIPLTSWLFTNPRHSKKGQCRFYGVWMIKKTFITSCSVMLVSVVPSHNMAMKFGRKILWYISFFLKKIQRWLRWDQRFHFHINQIEIWLREFFPIEWCPWSQ